MRISQADNTVQYWPNLGSQESAIVIGPVSPFPSVKCWADDGGLCRLFQLTDLQPKLGPVLALYQADCHFYCGIQFRNVSLLPRQTILEGRKQSSAEQWANAMPIFAMVKVKHGPVLAVKIWARIDRQVHTGVIIPATSQY